MMSYLTAAALIVPAYLLGSLPFGLLFVRWFTRQDLRAIGSGNIGATNARRAAGNATALAVLVCDVLKGAMPVLAALWVLDVDQPHWILPATALSAVTGHLFPIYLGFRPSGKGVATAAGAFGTLAPLSVLVALAVFLCVVALTRRVSLGSLCGTAVLVPMAWWATHNPDVLVAAGLAAILIFIRHKDNIIRLSRGLEPKIGDHR